MRASPRLIISVDGVPLPLETQNLLMDCQVERSLVLFDVCTLKFNDTMASLRDTEVTLPGRRLTVVVSEASGIRLQLFDGVTIQSELELFPNSPPLLTLRAFDDSHRMHSVSRTRVFVDVTLEDVVHEVADAYGWSAVVEGVPTIHNWILQGDQTDWEFLRQLASKNGYHFHIENNSVLRFSLRPTSNAESINLNYGANLLWFRRLLGKNEAEGGVAGILNIAPGNTLTISGVGVRFGGEMVVATTTHRYDPMEGFITQFEVCDSAEETVSRNLEGRNLTQPYQQGPVEAIVTDIADPLEKGRVRLRYPWLSDAFCSDWAMVAISQNDPSLQVETRVLVRFLEGDLHQPIVIGVLPNP